VSYTPEEILEHREDWFAALESGEFPQGEGALVRLVYAGAGDEVRREYCCLGVVCSLAELEENTQALRSDIGVFGPEQASSFLPGAAREWLGVFSNDPMVNFPPEKGGPQSCSYLNDDLGWTFGEISRAIRKHGFIPNHDRMAVDA
jgi:hypothetical protein